MFPLWRDWIAEWGRADAEPRDNGLRRAVQYHLAFLLRAAEAAPGMSEGLALARRGLPRLFA